MPEIKRRVHSYLAEYQCDKCKEGIMEGIRPHSFPVTYNDHRCTNCGETKNLNHHYPYVVHGEMEGK